MNNFAELDKRAKLRLAVSGICALIGAVTLVISAFGAWTDDRTASQIALSDLWAGLGAQASSIVISLLTPLVIAALLGLIGVMVRRRLVVGLGAAIALATTGLFLLQYSRLDGGIDRFYGGFTNAAGAAVLLVIATVLLPTSGEAGSVVDAGNLRAE